jgi:signal transduction histidine kinase
MALPKKSFHSVYFSVDSALLRELGERLVGRPHIALAELVKNSYDADARKVVIRFSSGRIEVVDNGHGMTEEEFESYWMRVGSPHKQRQRFSRGLRRPMAGSKGVGRLAAQFLANKLELHTASQEEPLIELEARVNWKKAVVAGDLTEARALVRIYDTITIFSEGSASGTLIRLSDLNQEWSREEFEALAKEIWWLQPPFRSNPRLENRDQRNFSVELQSPDAEIVEKFDTQMRAYLDIWHARLVGKLITEGSSRLVRLSLEFAGGEQRSIDYPAPDYSPHECAFEIRVFHLQHRQKHGIRVDQAREYLNAFGGVHVYDAGFHLPYYGHDTDWLGIEKDHSHRLSRSKLLPEELQVSEGLTYLPTNSRLLGVVHVDTAEERVRSTSQGKQGLDFLKIQVTRDRLVDNEAFQSLVIIVRWALDYYAVEEAKRAFAETEALRATEPLQRKVERVDEVIEQFKDDIPKPIYAKLRREIHSVLEATESEAAVIARQVGLLGALATAGISALAFEHELAKQFQALSEISEQLRTFKTDRRTGEQLIVISNRIEEWLERGRATRALFSHLLDEESREDRSRFKAKQVLESIVNNIAVLLRGMQVDLSHVDATVRLPEGRFSEWSAIFQNVFINSVNAMLDSSKGLISVSTRQESQYHMIVVQDTGHGIDLSEAANLFQPFVRRSNISSERRALGLGGSGLGLTIVRMIAEHLGCTADFIKPDKGFKAAFRLLWRERQP